MTDTKRARRTYKPPAYRLHKASGLARVRLDGGEIYLGPFGTDESRQAYAQLIAKHSSGAAMIAPRTSESESGLTINELSLAYLKFAQGYYRKGGVVTDEVDCIKSALRPLVALYGDLPAEEFGPVALKAVRQHMVDAKKVYPKKKPTKKKQLPNRRDLIGGRQFSRGFINKAVGKIRRMFKWAIEQELVEPTVLLKLQAVAPLLAGRTTAQDYPKRRPVPVDNIAAVKSQLKSQRTKDLIDLGLLCGARPGELVSLTNGMIDRSGEVWKAELVDHKMAHHGKVRVLYFGPKAQLILRKYLSADPDKRLFEVGRASVSSTIRHACHRAGVPEFTGHWLRHNAASSTRKEFGLDGAQAMMGHSHADTTEIYAELDEEKMVQIAREVG